jgi:translation initiation factor IF-2
MVKEKQNKDLNTRPPVVVVLGHVDHGKSSLLEAIKDFRITSKESGGITQHIGAYEVEFEGKKITFIDTPGHEAFYAMRSRGAKVADIAILVVAGEEGVKPQTKESIQCIKEAQIPAILAINKIDKSEANAQKVKNQLAKEDFVVEEMGGDFPVIETSATNKTGIKELLEMILLLAEMQDLKVIEDECCKGVIIESYLNEKRGITTTLLVKNGFLLKEDFIATESSYGRIKKLEDFVGKPIEQAGPSKPVSVLGFERLPDVGEKFQVFKNVEEARNYAMHKQKKGDNQSVSGDKKCFKIILKADVSGSLEAIRAMIENVPNQDIDIRVVKSGAGLINEDDIQMAAAGGAKIFGFQTAPSILAAKLASQKNVHILLYDVIYDLIEAIKKLLKAEVELEIIRRDIGKLKILKVFRTEKDKQIVGGRVTAGEVVNNTKLEILRDEEIVGKGKISQLQKERKSVEKGVADDEVGILYHGKEKIQEGDTLQFYIEEQKKIEL